MDFYPSIVWWPRVLNRDRMWKWELVARTISGGRSLAGPVPTARFDGGGLWMAEMSDVQVSRPNHVLAWRALSARLDGGATPIVMEARDVDHTPWPLVGDLPVVDQPEATNDDGSTPSDQSVYVSDVIQAELVNAAALRATTLTISLTNASALQGGEHFSIQHDTFSHRLYRIAKVVDVGSPSGSTYEVTIRPPLREATDTGTRIEFDNPCCVMRLASPDAMDLSLERRVYGQATVRLIEDFPPWSDEDDLT